MAADATESDDSPSPSASRPVSRTASERKKKAPKRRPAEPARPAKVALLVWKISCSLLSRAAKRTQRKALQEALGRLAAQHLVKKVLATVAQWERHALKNCNWRGEGDAKPAQTNLHLGVGWWELPELENYPVSVADATAAMLHAIQFGGSKEYGGAIGDLSSFVKEYVGSCRLTCVIKRYTFEEKKARFQHRDELRQAFEEQEEARGNFEERAKVIASTLVQKHADLKTFDALHHLATQRDKNFDVHISNSKTICDGYLSLQNVHVYQALGRIYPRLLALEKELEDTIQSVTGLADPGAEPEAIEEEEGLEDIKKEEESPRARARRRKETMRRRKALLEQQRVNKGPGEEADQVSNSRPALRFEDKAAHDKQLAALKEKFDRVLLEYDLVPDADKSRIAHLYTLANQGQQKLDQYQDQLQKAEEDIEVLAHRTKEALRAESEKKCWEMLRSGRLPTEMLGSLKKQSIDGPTPDDRDALKARTAALFSQIADRQKTTAEERDLQEELESLQQEIQEQEAVRVVEETQEAERIQTESVELPSLDAAFSPLRSSMEVCKRAMELASVEFVQLTTGATKLERKAEAVAGSMASLLEGRPSEQVKAQVNEWQALCQDLLLDMEQVADSVKVDGLPKGIADKVWMQKQAEIRGASRKKQEEAVEEKPKEKTSKKAAKQNAVTAKKQEMKIEKEMQDQALRKKQIMLGIEMLWSQLPENEVAADAVSSHGSSMVPSPASPASPAGAGPSRAARPTLQTQKSKNQLNPVSPLERILQHHRADIAAGHERRNSLVKQIEELQQKLEELSPEAQEVLKKAEQGIAERKAAQAANRALSPGGSAPPSPRAKSKPAERRATKSRASILQVGTNGAEEDDGAMSDDSDPDEAPEPMRLDPWMLAFPTDTPELGKKKWEFCKANRIKPHHLHDASRHKKYIFALRRMMKQCKRTLALKQKLLMKFLSGDALQKFKVQMQKTPQELEAEVDHEGRKLKERDAMIAKLLTFWHRRMQQLEDEKEAERETFRYKVKALLEDIQSLAKVLEDAALTKKRRRRVDADDLLTLRQQKAATAAAEAMRPRTSRAGEGNADIARFQAMMSQRSRRRQSVDQQAAEGVHRQEEKQERKKLAELLRKHLAQHRKSFEEENADKAEASDHSSSGSSKSSEEGDQLPGQHISDPRGDAQEGDAGASSEGFVLMRRRKHSLKEPPVQTLSSLPMLAGVQTVEGGRHRASVAGIRMFGRPSSRMRGTAKRKSSVARKDSIFENPAAMSRRLTDDSARSAALAQVLQMAQASDAASADDDASKVMQAASERIRRKSQEEALLKAQLAGAGPAQAVALKPLQAPTDLPGAVSFHGHAFGRRSSQRPGTRKHEDGESKRRKDSETPTPFVLGLRGTGSSQPGSRAASPEDSGPPSMATSRPPAKTRSASRIYQGRPSAAGLTLPLARAEDGGRTGGGKPGKRTKSPDHSRRSSGASEYDGDTGNEVSEEEMRADLFLKATYLHLGAFRQHYLHPSLKGQRPALSDAIMGENGEALFRSLIAQIVDLPSEMLRRAVRHFINTERARCLFIVKNSLIHQARLELEASQRTISILESDPNEVERQMKEGGPLFPALKKAKDSVATAKDTKPSPSPPESSSDSSSDEEPEKPAGGISPPSTQAQAVHRASIRGKLRRAGVHSFMAFAEGLHQLNRRPTRDQAIPGASDEMGVPMLQIRSVDGPRPHVAMDAAANEAPDQSATKTGSIKKRIGGSKTSTTLSERLREAQLAADAASSSRQGSQNASEKPPTSAMSLQTSMLKTMLKKPAVQDSKKQSSTMSLIGDYNWDKTLKKFDTLLRRGGLQNRSANQGYWESHFAYDVGPDGPLSSRLPDSEGRPLSAPGCRPIKHRPQPIKEEVEKTDESPGGSSPSKSPSIPPATPVDTEQPPAEPEEGGEKRASKNTPLLLSLARFMTKVKAKKSKREKLEEFFYVAEQKAKWSRRPSKPRLLTQEMEEEWAELQDKVRMEKGKWIQHSRRKVEAMFQEEEFGENWDRQQRTLQRERNPRQQDNIFDTLSFVRWKVNRQLRQAMQDVEKGNKVNLPRKQDRSAGPPPPDPVWIVGDREDSGLEKARERIATLRAKKYRGKPFMPMGQGRGWRVDQDLFDHVDELFQQYGEPAAINEDAVTTRAASEMVGAKQKERRASDSDSESGHSDSSSALQRRVVSAPASMRRVQARRITRSRAKSRELSVLPPWMRQMLVQDDIWQQLPESSPWDRTCWLQPVRVKGRTATDRAMTPEQVAKALSRKSSRSDKPRRVAEDPVLFVRKACRSIVEEYAEKAPEDAAPTLKPEEPTRPGSPVSPDTETRHNRVMEILERDSLLTQEPLERVLEEDEEESGTGSINMSVFAEAAGAGLGPAHAEGDGLSKPSSSKDRLAQEIYTITSRPAKRQPPALSMQTLVFEMPSKEPTGTKGHRCGDVTHSLSTDASTESISSQDKAKAKPQRRPRGIGSPQRHKRDHTMARRRKHSELDVVARKMVDLSLLENIGTEHRRRSLLHEAPPPSSEPVQAEKPVPAPPQMTVDIGKLSAVLAKQWSEVTAEEVQARRLGMQKLKAAKLAPKATIGETVDVIALESLYEVDKANAAQESEVRQSSKASALSDVSERKASKTNSLGNARMSRLNSMGATAGLSQSLLDVDVELQAEDMAPAALQTHLTQWRSWRREGRLPSAPVHLPPAPIAQHPTKAAPVRQNSGSAAQPPAGLHLDISVPSRAINEYLSDFRDQDLDGVLEGISQTPADDFETNEFVWPPPKRSTERSRGAATAPPAPPATKLPLVQGRGIIENRPSSTGESWVRALTSRADSPAWLLDALDSRASSRTSRSYGDRASPPPDLHADGHADVALTVGLSFTGLCNQRS